MYSATPVGERALCAGGYKIQCLEHRVGGGRGSGELGKGLSHRHSQVRSLDFIPGVI